jgi:hypothetical protein
MRRLNVQEQNSEARAVIAEIAWRFRRDPSDFPYLLAELNAKGIDPLSGMLAELKVIPEQGGNYVYGCWVTSDGEFIDFEMQLDYADPLGRTVEAWGARAQQEPNAHVPGTGKNFAYLALDVLQELHSQSNNSLQRP